MSKVRELRIKQGLTQAQLANMLGIKAGPVGSWERDATNPSKEHIIQLCKIFNVTPEYLMQPSAQEQELIAIYHKMTFPQRKLLIDLVKEFKQPKDLKD